MTTVKEANIIAVDRSLLPGFVQLVLMSVKKSSDRGHAHETCKELDPRCRVSLDAIGILADTHPSSYSKEFDPGLGLTFSIFTTQPPCY